MDRSPLDTATGNAAVAVSTFESGARPGCPASPIASGQAPSIRGLTSTPGHRDLPRTLGIRDH